MIRLDPSDSRRSAPALPALALALGAVVVAASLSAGCDVDSALIEPPVDLRINEFMAANATAVEDDEGEFPDWIELYNVGSETIELGGLFITDDLAVPDKDIFSDDLVVQPGGYLLLWADGKPELGSQHLDFKLSASGEQIAITVLTDSGVLPITTVSFEAQEPDVAQARVPDGAATWVSTEHVTPGSSNG